MKIYLVGGAIRNKLLKLPVKERDWVVVGSEVKDLENNVDTLKYKSSIDRKSSEEISKIVNLLFKKSNNKE